MVERIYETPESTGSPGSPGDITPEEDGTWWRELREMLALGLPLVASQVAFSAINTIDVLMIGWLGPQKLAAVTLAHNLYFPVWLFSMGVLLAVAPIASQARGAGDTRTVRRAARQGLWVAILIAVPSGLLLAQMEGLLLFTGQDPQNAADAQSYMIPYLLGWLPSFGFIVMRVFLASLDLTRWVFFTIFFGVFLNAFLDYGLIFGKFGFPELGLPGAGYASAIVFWVMFLILLGYGVFHKRLRHYEILVRFWRPDWQVFREIFKIGLPIGGTIIMESALFAAAGLMMGRIGTLELAAHAIALQCVVIAFMLPLGVSQAATIRVGFFTGAGQHSAVHRAGWTALGLGLCFSILTMTTFLVFPEELMLFFLEEGQADVAKVLAFGTSFLLLAGLFQIVDATQVVAGANLRGLKDTAKPMMIAAFSYWGIGFPTAYLLGFVFGLEGQGIWMGLAFGLLFSATILTVRWARRERYGLVKL